MNEIEKGNRIVIKLSHNINATVAISAYRDILLV